MKRLGHLDSVPSLRPGARRRHGGPRGAVRRGQRAELQRRPADVVVGNFFVFGAQIAAEAEGVPFAFLVSNLLSFPGRARRRSVPASSPARGPLGRARDAGLNRFMARLFDKGLDRLNEVRRENGLGPRVPCSRTSSAPTACC